jgi:hypothetical protein
MQGNISEKPKSCFHGSQDCYLLHIINPLTPTADFLVGIINALMYNVLSDTPGEGSILILQKE